MHAHVLVMAICPIVCVSLLAYLRVARERVRYVTHELPSATPIAELRTAELKMYSKMSLACDSRKCVLRCSFVCCDCKNVSMY